MKWLLAACVLAITATHAQENPVRLSLPLPGLYVTSPFGYRIHPIAGRPQMHSGVDLRARRDTVRCILDGRVMCTSLRPGLGLSVRAGHGDVESVYGHLSVRFVSAGDTVVAGQPIGISGSTGLATGEHLHFEVRYRGRPINPLAFLAGLALQPKQEE